MLDGQGFVVLTQKTELPGQVVDYALPRSSKAKIFLVQTIGLNVLFEHGGGIIKRIEGDGEKLHPFDFGLFGKRL